MMYTLYFYYHNGETVKKEVIMFSDERDACMAAMKRDIKMRGYEEPRYFRMWQSASDPKETMIDFGSWSKFYILRED